MTDPFDAPGGNRIDWADYLGRLLLILPIKQETDVKTTDFGEKDAIRADIVVLDGADAPEDLPDILVFPLVLQGQLRRSIGRGRPIVARLGKDDDEIDAKGRVTRKGPWRLSKEISEEDKQLAREYLNRRPPTVAPDDKYDDVPF